MPNTASLLRPFVSGVLLCTASAWSIPAQAEEEFPGALQEAAGMECVPTCLMCHTSNPGTAATWTTKALPLALNSTNKLKPKAGDVEAFKVAFAEYAATHPTEVAAIKAGRDPQTGQDVCSPSYGCGATFARSPSGKAPASAAGVLSLAAALWLARRRR